MYVHRMTLVWFTYTSLVWQLLLHVWQASFLHQSLCFTNFTSCRKVCTLSGRQAFRARTSASFVTPPIMQEIVFLVLVDMHHCDYCFCRASQSWTRSIFPTAGIVWSCTTAASLPPARLRCSAQGQMFLRWERLWACVCVCASGCRSVGVITA